MPMAFDKQRIGQYGNGEVSSTLAARDYKDATDLVAFPSYGIRAANTSSNGWGIQEELTHTLDTSSPHAVSNGMAVRRLTPTECERLQGFPDGFTQIPYRNKPAEKCPDGPRYKALGNSMAVPVMRWIGERIHVVRAI